MIWKLGIQLDQFNVNEQQKLSNAISEHYGRANSYINHFMFNLYPDKRVYKKTRQCDEIYNLLRILRTYFFFINVIGD